MSPQSTSRSIMYSAPPAEPQTDEMAESTAPEAAADD